LADVACVHLACLVLQVGFDCSIKVCLISKPWLLNQSLRTLIEFDCLFNLGHVKLIWWDGNKVGVLCSSLLEKAVTSR